MGPAQRRVGREKGRGEDNALCWKAMTGGRTNREEEDEDAAKKMKEMGREAQEVHVSREGEIEGEV